MSTATRSARPVLHVCVACLVLVQWMSVADAAEVGRLFLRPADRAEIERLRQDAALQPPPAPGGVSHETSNVATEPPPLPPPAALTVNGYVARSGGAPTVWVNGSETTGADLSALGVDGARLKLRDDRVRLPRSDGGAPIALKPGQSFDPATRQVTDAYERTPSP